MTIELVETVEIGSGGAATISFTSIPQDAKHLLLKTSLRGDNDPLSSPQSNAVVTINSSGSNLLEMRLTGDGSSAGEARGSSFNMAIASSAATATTFSSNSYTFANYTETTAKQISGEDVTENNATAARQNTRFVLWSNSAGLTAITLTAPSAGNFVQYSTASLYKIS